MDDHESTMVDEKMRERRGRTDAIGGDERVIPRRRQGWGGDGKAWIVHWEGGRGGGRGGREGGIRNRDTVGIGMMRVPTVGWLDGGLIGNHWKPLSSKPSLRQCLMLFVPLTVSAPIRLDELGRFRAMVFQTANLELTLAEAELYFTFNFAVLQASSKLN